MKKFGLLGGNLSHSKSPILHREIMKSAKISGDYMLFEAKNEEELKEVIERLRNGEIHGINVTIPHKQRVIPYLDSMSEAAKSIGAVNVIANQEGKLVGYNTDYDGFRATLKKMKLLLKDEEVFVLGAGGASKAVVKALLDEGARVSVVSREPQRAATSFCNFTGVKFITYQELNEKRGVLIVNCTPCGMVPNIDTSAVSKECVRNFENVIDIVYNPYTTQFMSFATSNAQVENGLYMLVVQAIRAQEIWNGTEIECVDTVYKHMQRVYQS